ncbi:family 20 glycosylhydrolase [Pseudoflavonifractor sp. An176]|uniref:family 20 glycosylhydrolase n=1 Tax=Pseudoflavonifractor sp. An176 TaxID=1965572 RepID=UPI001302347D|nr:family 20 glycosylhydrolase [Pseudoflavonifractor sp. An176]
MRNWIKKGLALVLTAAMVVGISPLHGSAADTDSAPGIASVPTVQSATAGEGSFTLTSEARFFIVADSDPTGTDLATYVQTANSEFAARGIPGDSVLPIVYGDESMAKSGDIVVKVDGTAVTDSQGYALDITSDNITVTANSAIGVLYGLHTVLQSMIANGTTVMAGTVSDYPDVPERSLYLDAGRVFYTVDMMKSFIHTLSWNKMNVLYLDFSNNNATRFFLDDMNVTVAGTDYDVSTCKPDNGYWTEADMNEIMAEAEQYGVQVIPTLDSPGHIGGVYSINNSWFYRASATDYDAKVGKITLDLSNEDAYAFGQALVAKYVDYFASKGCTSFNIAADEASYADGTHMNSTDPRFVNYVNDLNDYIVSKGMTTRMFNDAVKSVDSGVSKDIIILYWVPASPNAQALLAAGYDVVNFVYTYVYYAYGASSYWNADLSKVYGWNPGIFGDSANAELGDNGYAYPDSVGKVLGGNFAIWSDYGYNYGKTGADVIKGTSCAYQRSDYSVRQKIYAVAERTWNQDGATASLSAWEATLLDAPAGISVSTGDMDATVLPEASAVTPAAPSQVDKTLLEKTIAYAETLSTDGVTDSAVAAFQKALTEAKAVMADTNATQEQVNAAWDNLLEGIWGLGLVQGDKTLLEELIARADEMMDNVDKYVETYWQELVDALAAAKDVMADGDAMQEDVGKAADALLDAILAQRFKADKSVLEELVNRATQMVENADKYVETHWQELLDALAGAQAIMADQTLSEDDQAKVDEAADALLDAILAQRFKADKSILDDLINKAEGINLDGYTAESVATFRTALANAQAVMADNSLSEDDQATVDAAVAALSDAMNGLTAGGAPETTDKPEATQKPENNVPQTGDTAHMMGYVLSALATASLLLAVVVVEKRRRNG